MIVMAALVPCQCGSKKMRDTSCCSICRGSAEGKTTKELREAMNPTQAKVPEYTRAKESKRDKRYRSITIAGLGQ